jgi:hypothetical protein
MTDVELTQALRLELAPIRAELATVHTELKAVHCALNSMQPQLALVPLILRDLAALQQDWRQIKVALARCA